MMFLFTALSLSAMPMYVALFSAVLSTLFVYTISSKALFSEKNNQSMSKIETQEFDNHKLTVRFFIAALFLSVNCAISAAGIGFGCVYVLSDSSKLSRQMKFNLPRWFILSFTIFASCVEFFGRLYFTNYKKTISSMMTTIKKMHEKWKKINSVKKWSGTVLLILISAATGSLIQYKLGGITGEIWKSAGIGASVGLMIWLIILNHIKLTENISSTMEDNPKQAQPIQTIPVVSKS
jgi:hypothetical protein